MPPYEILDKFSWIDFLNRLPKTPYVIQKAIACFILGNATTVLFGLVLPRMCRRGRVFGYRLVIGELLLKLLVVIGIQLLDRLIKMPFRLFLFPRKLRGKPPLFLFEMLVVVTLSTVTIGARAIRHQRRKEVVATTPSPSIPTLAPPYQVCRLTPPALKKAGLKKEVLIPVLDTSFS